MLYLLLNPNIWIIFNLNEPTLRKEINFYQESLAPN